MIVRKTSVLDTQYSTLPTDWLEMLSVSLTSGETHRLTLVGAGGHD